MTYLIKNVVHSPLDKVRLCIINKKLINKLSTYIDKQAQLLHA